MLALSKDSCIRPCGSCCTRSTLSSLIPADDPLTPTLSVSLRPLLFTSPAVQLSCFSQLKPSYPTTALAF